MDKVEASAAEAGRHPARRPVVVARFGLCGIPLVLIEALLEAGCEQFGKPIAGFQVVRRRLVQMVISVNRSTLVALRLGRIKDAGAIGPAQVGFGKMDSVRQAQEVARETRNSLAANGITLELA